MPSTLRVNNPRVLVISDPLSPSVTTPASITSTSGNNSAFGGTGPIFRNLVALEEQSTMLRKVDAIISTGANVVVSSSIIDPECIKKLTTKGIVILRTVREVDAKRLAAGFGIPVIHTLLNTTNNSANSNLIGIGECLYTLQVHNKTYSVLTFPTTTDATTTATTTDIDKDAPIILNSANATTATTKDTPIIPNTANTTIPTTLVVGTVTGMGLPQIQTVIHDALITVHHTLQDLCVLPGAGFSELAICATLRRENDSPIIGAFARAVEAIPIALAVNSGHSELAVKQYIQNSLSACSIGERREGIDIDTLQPLFDPFSHCIYDSYRAKLTDYSAFSLAVDTAGLLLRIDQVVRSTPLIHPTQPTDNTANNPTNTQPHAYRGLRPEAFTKDPSVERREMEQRRKANKKFYGQKQRQLRKKAEETTYFS